MHRVAAIQMNSGPEVSGNLASAGGLVERAVEAGAELVVLPENFALMPRNEADRMQVAEAMGSGPIQSFLADQATSTT